MEKDIRWIQRFSNYRKALARLSEAVELFEERDLSNIERDGLIKAFEYTYELAWNTLQDILIDKKDLDKGPGPRLTIEWALEEGYISNLEHWRNIHEARKTTVHSYDEQMAIDTVEI